MKQISLSYKDGPAAIATLHEKQAPVTCDLLWAALETPVTVTAFHAMFAGPEIMTGLPPAAQTFDPSAIPAENQTCFPGAGDVLWYFQAENQMRGLSGELWEIGAFYGDGGRIFGPLGWTPCNIWARITEGLDEFARACAELRITGAQPLTYSRITPAL